ncbi:MAG: hypothetical protein IJ849_12440 [Selenomonadaceae bacterium]|nr:hypothetical protein [Selenomonadaceae bacterium]
MNFIWDITLQAERDGIEAAELFFRPTEAPSPCYEQSFACLNQAHITDPNIDINPLYRFHEIFQYFLHPDVFYFLEKESQQFILYAFDAIVHWLAEVDLCHGMTKREFYVRQVRRELKAGVFGERAAKTFASLTKEEQLAVADELYQVMESGSGLDSFCRILCQLFPAAIVYQVKKHPQVIYIYLSRERDVTTNARWELLKDLFLPLGFEIRVFWDKHFGIMGVDETMRLDKIAIF